MDCSKSIATWFLRLDHKRLGSFYLVLLGCCLGEVSCKKSIYPEIDNQKWLCIFAPVDSLG